MSRFTSVACVLVLLLCVVGCRSHGAKSTATLTVGYSKSTRLMADFEATGTLAEYKEACKAMEEFMQARLALPARERFAATLELLAEHRDVQNSRFREHVIAVFDRHGWPVAEEVRRVRVEAGRKTSAADVVAGRVAAKLLCERSRSSSSAASTTQTGGGTEKLVPYAFWNDLRYAVAWYCPDRDMRLDVLVNSHLRSTDVADPDPDKYLADAEDVWIRDGAAYRDWFESLSNREGDGINISVIDCTSWMGGTSGAMLFYFYGPTLTDPGPHAISDVVEKVRTALIAAAKFDASPESQERIKDALENSRVSRGDEFIAKADADAFKFAGVAPLMFAVLKAVEANDVVTLQSLATKDFAKELREAKTKNLWGSLTGDSEVRRLRITDIDGDYRGIDRADKEDSMMSFSISWQTAAGIWSKPERCYYWFEREKNVRRLAGIRGIGTPVEK